MKSCVTISLVEQARGGPFVFWDDIATSCRRASALGFDAVELFLPSATTLDAASVRDLLAEQQLELAAVGTGAGWVLQQLTLTDADSEKRRAARAFVHSMIQFGGPFGAPAIIGSMQGRWNSEVDRATALVYLRDALSELAEAASSFQVPVIYEPLNRYETNLCNTIRAGLDLLDGIDGVVLLADLFHMNIEEADIAAALREGAEKIGHIHFVDSNRRAVGAGHTDFQPIRAALGDMNYSGYLSAEAFPLPDSETAARLTMDAFQTMTREQG